MNPPSHIILSRTDSIGDVMLSLPMAGRIKERWPDTTITFLCRGYTLPVVRCCRHVHHAITYEELASADPVGSLRALRADALIHVFPDREVARWARAASVPMRIGTAHRWWHWTTCTHRVRFSRRQSDLHEAQLNLKLLAPFGGDSIPTTAELAMLIGWTPQPADAMVRDLLNDPRRTVVLHPLSKGSAVEWGLDHFTELIQRLDPATHRVIITGTAAEAERYRAGLPLHLPHVVDAGGRLTLDQLIALIAGSHALVAASTGPLHIAAACGIRTIGLYADVRPIHPGRWGPLGRDAHALVAEGPHPPAEPAELIRAIDPDRVLRALLD